MSEKLAILAVLALAVAASYGKNNSRSQDKRGSGNQKDPEILGPQVFVKGVGYVENKEPISIDDVIRKVSEADSDIDSIVLYHSGDASIAKKIHSYGLAPTVGEWVQEVLYGATDDEELIEEMIENEGNALSFLDNEPTWVAIKVSRKIDKNYNEITEQDIKNHGHLSIFILDRDESSRDVFKNIDGEHVESLNGRRMEFWRSDLYEEADWRGGGGRTEMPFGVEPGDYVTSSSLRPDYTLTGEALVTFLHWWYKRKNKDDAGIRSWR